MIDSISCNTCIGCLVTITKGDLIPLGRQSEGKTREKKRRKKNVGPHKKNRNEEINTKSSSEYSSGLNMEETIHLDLKLPKKSLPVNDFRNELVNPLILSPDQERVILS